MRIICYDSSPMKDPVETAELLAFTRIAESKSFSRAAAELGLPRATIGRRLARLEERLDVRLLRRTTRSVVLTDAGEVFYRQACIALDALAGAEASVRREGGVVSGELRISVPLLMSPAFEALLWDFARRFPEVRLHVHFSSELVDLKRSRFDVAIRATSEVEPGLIARTITRMPLVAVASPRYLAEHGTPRSVRDLRKHRCLVGFARGELAQTHWPAVGGGKRKIEGWFVSNEVSLLCSAALEGLGIAVLPLLLVGPHLARGELVHVLPNKIGAEARIAIVYPERELVPPQVRAFVEVITKLADAELERLGWSTSKRGKPSKLT
jgi:DNA-binding transcriptional LysR family regulator